MNSAKKIPSPLVSLFPIAFLIGMLFATIHTFGSDALSGGSQISLLATTGMCVFIGMAFYRIPWKDYELAITNNISGVATAIIILLIISALSGTWMISGVVPTLIYYGGFQVDKVNPMSISFPQVISTMMACPDMEVESRVLKALNSAQSFGKLSGGGMGFYDANDNLVMVLVRK